MIPLLEMIWHNARYGVYAIYQGECFMARGIFFYLLVWLVVTLGLYAFSRMSKREMMTLYRCILYGLGTATAALVIVLLIVYLF